MHSSHPNYVQQKARKVVVEAIARHHHAFREAMELHLQTCEAEETGQLAQDEQLHEAVERAFPVAALQSRVVAHWEELDGCEC